VNSQPTAFVAGAALLPARAAATLGQKVGAGRNGGFAEHCSAPAKPAGCAKPAVEGTAASAVGAPLIEDCLAWLECRVIPEPHIQKTYDLFLGQVVAAWSDPDVFSDGRWHFPDAQRRSIHYQAGGNFFATGEAFEA